MTPVTLPAPPTDGTHPNARPVVYAHRPEYKNNPVNWVQWLGDLLHDVAANPSVRREIDGGLPPGDSTFAVKREFSEMHRAKATQGTTKPRKLTIGQKPVSEPKPDKPARLRNRQHIPTGLPKATGAGYPARSCPLCAEVFNPTNSRQVWCKSCANRGNQDRKNERRKEQRDKATIRCDLCGSLVNRTGSTQKFCPDCRSGARKEGMRIRNAARKKPLTIVICLQCGVETTAKIAGKRFCGALCYERWYKAQKGTEVKA